ncbi:MAG: DUF4215 domain-containing protein [Myxococcales bacterium]|nr:DUF4215 domain-containing protein [Myxococcales bacterium]
MKIRPLLLIIAALSLAPSCKGEDPPPAAPDPECGNGLLEAGETCEGLPPPVGCDMTTCTVDPDYSCIPMFPVPAEGDSGGPVEPMEVMSTCELLDHCGDGIVDPDEDCDDGDMTVGDGCSGCRIDPLWTCTGEPSDCFQCGDGFLDPGEECDDGEQMDPPMYANQGCEQCTIQPGWECYDMLPSLCGPICGDGIWLHEGLSVGFAEGCDDGNLVDDDGCNASCVVETDCECTGMEGGTSTCVCGVGDSSGTDTGGTDTGGTDTGGSSTGGSSTG